MSFLDDLNKLIMGELDHDIHELSTGSRLIFINYVLLNASLKHDNHKITMDLEFDYSKWTLSFQNINETSRASHIESSVVYKFLKDHDSEIFDNDLWILFLLGYVNE